jgi:hypothetical protein
MCDKQSKIRGRGLFQALAGSCLALFAAGACAGGAADAAGPIPVKVAQVDGRYQLLRGGEIYAVKGAGLEFGNMESLVRNGGNSFRTWRTDNGRMTGQEVLDRAHALGLTVALCIEIGRERHGFDYDDEAAVAAQLEYARGEVLKYKDHPALLNWVIGNEPNLYFENPRVFDAINDISRMIHEVDGQHPTTTALAGFDARLAGLIAERAPDLDFVSIQMYGDIVNLPRTLTESGYDGPYAVTEWGAIGHWEVGKTAWGAPIEQNSSDKAASYLRAWETALEPDTERLIGSYVFLWGQKQERTPTWYGMFLPDGSETEVIDVMHYIWNGEWPDNRAPRVASFRLDGRGAADDIVLDANGSYPARLTGEDPDGDALEYRWAVMRESTATQSGGDKEEVPETLGGLVEAGADGEATVRVPGEAGAYRLFVYVHDGRGKAGHANIPFQVK